MEIKRLTWGLACVLAGAAVVAVLTGCGPQPVPTPAPTPQLSVVSTVLYFPVIEVNDYEWQRSGYGRPWKIVGRDRAFHRAGMWSYTWGLGNCLDDVPMLFNGNPAWLNRGYLERCGVTSPVLLLGNEPEWGTQGDMTPEEVADLLHWAEGVFPGEIYGIGNLVSHAGFLDRTLTAYNAKYGGVPRLAGVHLHIYINEGFKVDDPLDPKWQTQNEAQLQTYLAVMRKWGIPEKVVVSECCLLGAYSEDVYLEIMRRYRAWLDNVEEVQTVAWFSVAYDGFPHSNLMEPWTGKPVDLGRQWLDMRWRDVQPGE